MKRAAFILLVIALAVAARVSAQQQDYTISSVSSSLQFQVSAKIHEVHGTSGRFGGTVTGDPSDIRAAKIHVELDPQTFNTGNVDRDKVMRGDCLQIQQFPLIVFESSGIEASEIRLQSGTPLRATVHGILTLHGVRKPVAVPVTIEQSGRDLAVTGDMLVLLDDYGIYRPKVLLFRLDNKVHVHFKIAAERHT